MRFLPASQLKSLGTGKINGGNGKQWAILFYQANCSTRSKGPPFTRDRLKLILPEGPKGVGEGGLLSVVDKKAHSLK